VCVVCYSAIAMGRQTKECQRFKNSLVCGAILFVLLAGLSTIDGIQFLSQNRSHNPRPKIQNTITVHSGSVLRCG